MKRKLLSTALLVVSVLGFNANAQQYEDGADLTHLIANPGFEEAGGNGWKLDTSKGGTGNLTNWHGGDETNYCAEAFAQNFDVYQVIEGVPDGLYEVSVQAFYRTGDNQSAWNAYQSDPDMTGAAKVYPEVYLNEFSTKIRNVMEIQFTENLAGNCYPTPDGTYTLNGMNSASAAFSLEDPEKNFTMPAYGLVTDGQIRLGIRKLEGPTTGDFWTLWDNFKLTYRAKNETALTSVIESMVAQYSSYADLNTEYINAYESALVDAAIKAASEAIGKDGDTMYDALIALNAVYNDTKAHVTANVALKTAKDALTAALTTYQETARAEATQKANELMSEDTDNLSTEEINALTGQINYAIAALKIPAAVDNATIDNPVDLTSLIVNADIEQGATVGWSSTKNGGNGPNIDSGIHGKSIEFWNENAANLQFNIWQDLVALPAGTYELSAIAANSLNREADLGNDGRAYIYAATSADESDQTQSLSDPVAVQVEGCLDKNATYSVAFVVKEGEKVTLGAKTVGTMTARWFVADDFTLMYYGTEENLLVEQSDYDALNAAIAEVTDKIGFEDKEYAPYNNIEAIATLSAAQTLNQNFTKLKKNVQAVTTTLTEAEWTENDGEVNAIYDGSFANAEVGPATAADAPADAKGWVAESGGTLRMIFDATYADGQPNSQISKATSGKGIFVYNGAYVYGKTDGYTMPLEANTIYELNFKYAGWNSAIAEKNDKGEIQAAVSVSVLNEANQGLAKKDFVGAPGIMDDLRESGKLLFTTGDAGNYTLKIEGYKGNFVFTDVTIYKAVDPSVEVAVSEAGYATFSSELPLDLANIDGGTAYIVADEAEGEYIKLTEQTEAVPANTGLIIAGEGTVTIPVVATANPLDKKNYLVAVNKNTTVESGYVLGWDGRDQTTVGFYVVDETPAPVQAGQAYLELPASEEEEAAGIKVLRFTFGDGTATAIETAEVADADADGAIYNVAGQQVGKDYKGIVIKNGKKYLNK